MVDDKTVTATPEYPAITPQEALREFGVPPLENHSALVTWVDTVLDGYSAEETERWIDDFVHVYPIGQQQSAKDLLLESVNENRIAGTRREVQVHQELVAQYPNASVQDQHTLLDVNGNKAIDPDTKSGRRLDHVVIQDGKVIDVVETTSQTAEKDKQLAHEERVRANHGVYIRDKETGKLLVVPKISRVVRKS